MTATSSIQPLSNNSSTAQSFSLVKSALLTKAWFLRLKWHTHAYLTVGVLLILTLLSLSLLHLHSLGLKIVSVLTFSDLAKVKPKTH